MIGVQGVAGACKLVERIGKEKLAGVKVLLALDQDKAGDSATLMLGAANCDFAEFSEADQAVFDRDRNRHLAFGGGAHRCLGSNLARLELRVALEEFHRRIPVYELADDDIHFSPGIRQADRLPLVFPAR